MYFRSASSNAYSAISAALLAWGAQTAWFIDPATGNDAGDGSASAPLKTMGEFNARMAGQVVSVPATLQLVGDVLDQPLTLQCTRFSLNASLTVSGTRTDTASGLVSVVTPLGPSSTGPWQVDTTGITWTAAMVNQQVRLSTGHTCMILEVVDADTIILGALCTITSLVVSTAPTVGSTLTVASLSRAAPPVILAMGQQVANSFQLIVQNVAFETAATSNGYAFAGGVNTCLFGCEIKQVGELRSESPLTLRGCGFTLTTTFNNNPSRLVLTQGCVVRGLGSTLFNQQTGQTSHTSLSLTGARLSYNSSVGTLAGIYIQKSAGPVLLNGTNTYVVCTGTVAGIHGSTGNTGIAIDVTSGTLGYFSNSKPTVSATVSDARVGGTTKAYAAIPFINVATTANNGAGFTLS